MTRWLIAAGVGVAFAGLSARADDPPKADPPKVEKKADENPFLTLEKERATLEKEAMKEVRAAPRARRTVILEFPSMANLKRWWDSPEYQELCDIRKRSADSNIVTVDGA